MSLCVLRQIDAVELDALVRLDEQIPDAADRARLHEIRPLRIDRDRHIRRLEHALFHVDQIPGIEHRTAAEGLVKLRAELHPLILRHAAAFQHVLELVATDDQRIVAFGLLPGVDPVLDLLPDLLHDGQRAFLILLAHERYDVPFKARDGARLEDGSEVFSYFVCAICPVKPGKELLSYIAEEKTFHNRSAGWAAGMPEMGFLFPAFDGRRTNLYNCLFYTHSSGADNQPLIDALFHVQPPMPADEQRDTFSGVLRNALDDECSLAVVQQVRQEIKDRIDAWQEAKSDDPLVVSGDELKDVLESCGVSEEKRMQFGAQFDESFGGGAVLNPRNLIDVKKCVVKTPDVSITVNPERPDLIETRTLGGVRYILIKADEGVELNGIDLAKEAE